MSYLDENGLEHFWGKIKDHVSSAIAPKADDADVLHKTGTETVSGEKVFSGIQTTAAGNETALMVIKDATLVKGATPATNHYLSLGFIDSTGNSYAQDVSSRLAVMEYKSPSEADPEGYLQMYDMGFNGGGSAILRVGHDKDNIRFASAPATSDERTASTDIVTRGYMEASEWNWQKTKKAGAVVFKPVPESDLEPVVDFMFTETSPAEGEKGPENPSTITGVSSIRVTRSGKNLLDIPSLSSRTTGGITFTPSADGFISISGTFTASAYYTLRDNLYLPTGETLYLSIKEGPHSSLYYAVLQLVAYDANNAETEIIWQRLNANPIPITIPDGAKYRIRLGVFNTLDPSAPVVITPMAELVSLSQEWVPFDDYDLYTIQLGDTYYGGSLDVATGVMTVTWGAKIIDGTESFSRDATYSTDTVSVFTSQLGLPQSVMSNNQSATTRFCSHFIWSNSIVVGTYSTWGTATNTLFKLSASEYPDVTSFTNWLASEHSAGHPVILGFLLNNPYTVQLTPTQIRSLPALDKYEPRINTVYTDQEAVQVGYQRFYDENRIAAIEARLAALEGN